MTWSAGSGPACAPGCRRGTSPTRSTRCPASRGRCPARSSRCRSGRSCWARRSPRRLTPTRWRTPRCWHPSSPGARGRVSEDRRGERAGGAVTSRERSAAGRSFGEEGGKLTYGGYLRLPELLAQQGPQGIPPAHDELLFITLHQAYELWVRQLLQRPHVIERLLVSQIDVLETMTPQDFLEFRAALAPASGFQSVQFRELEFLSGAKDPGFVARFRELTEDERQRPARRLAEPTLWDAYTDLLRSRGLEAETDDQILASLVTVARDRGSHDDLWQLAEDLLTHDELAGLWRARHVQMVERQIGTKSGTGGSTGAPYLHKRVPMRYYPLLWELRDWLSRATRGA